MSLSHPWLERADLSSTTGRQDPFRYPESAEEWQNWYQYRFDAYVGVNYSEDMIKNLQLFRAEDDDGKIIALTRRLHRDVQFVVNVGVSACGLGQATLQKDKATRAEMAIGEQIWRASRLDRFGSAWAATLCSMGDLFLEPVRMSRDRIVLTSHDPRKTVVDYDDALGIDIVEATVTTRIEGQPQVDVYGNVTEAGILDVHQRRMDAVSIEVESTRTRVVRRLLERPSAVVDEMASGEHGLGVVPLVHIPCIPYVDPEHGLWVAHALDRPLAEVDSLMSQVSAIGDRFANPKPYLIGAKLSSGDNVSRFGRWINAYGNDADKVEVGYMEASMAGVQIIADRIDAMLRDIRLTLPEYLFSGSAANLSGEALKMLATRYVAKYEDIRARLYGGLAMALQMGVEMALGREHDPTRQMFCIEGPPLLPSDVAARLDELTKADALGVVSRVDKVRHAQGLDIADSSVTPEAYIETLDAEAEAAAERAREMMPEVDDPTEEAEPPNETPEPPEQ